MIAITISQPFAALISDGEKFVENRTWPAPEKHIGKPIAIHAGKGTQYMSTAEMRDRGFATGVIVANAVLYSCVRRDSVTDADLPPWLTVDTFLSHEHAEGPWCWVLDEVVPLDEPIPAKGKQGIWKWDIND